MIVRVLKVCHISSERLQCSQRGSEHTETRARSKKNREWDWTHASDILLIRETPLCFLFSSLCVRYQLYFLFANRSTSVSATWTDPTFSTHPVCVDSVWESLFDQSERMQICLKETTECIQKHLGVCACVRVCVCVLWDSRTTEEHRCRYFLSSSHLVIWGADKKRTAWWFISFFFFFFPLQPDSLHRGLLFLSEEQDQMGNVFIPFFFF